MVPPKSHVVRRASGPVHLACDAAAWARADRLSIDEYPWYVSGDKQGTSAALLYDHEAIYVLFVCQDRHISAIETRPNGLVHRDSCVEFFAAVAPGMAGGYFNFEANCCGTTKLGFGGSRQGRRYAPTEVLGRIEVRTSISAATKEDSPDDDGWWLAAAIPFSAISDVFRQETAPGSGTVWPANLYRCGGKTDPQYACWNPIDWPEPDYHRPEFFGELTFE